MNKPSRELERRVDDSELDIAFFSRETDLKPLWHYSMVAAGTAGVLPDGPVSLGDLSGPWLLLLERGTRHRRAVDQSFRRAGATTSKVLELGDVSIQLAMAREGVGIAIVPDFALPEEDELARWSVNGLAPLVVVERRATHGNRRAAMAFAEAARGSAFR